MGIAERKIRQKEDVHAAILKAAWRLVEKEGWQAVSIRKIAEAIEYSAPVIYDHLQNKDAILLEFTKEGFRILNERLQKAKSQFTDPARQLEAMAFSYWHFAFENGEYYRLMYGLGMPTCEMVQKITELSSFTDLIMSSLKEMINSSNKKDLDPFLKFHTFWSLIHGLISINMMGKENTIRELNTMVLNDFMTGFIAGIRG